MKEIGGYMELDASMGNEFHESAVAVNSGRHALEYIIRAKNIKKIHIPYFLCASVNDLCIKCDCECEFYDINIDFTPDFNKRLDSCEYLYIVNYYGQIPSCKIEKYKSTFKNIIVDNAQAFFELPVKDVDTIYTCRKFFGVSDGGYVYTDTILNSEFATDISYERIKFVLGRFETDAQSFYKNSAQNNKFFATEPLKYMSKLTHNMLKNLDYKFISDRRSENFEYLHSCLKDMNDLKLTVPVGPYMYPLYLKDAKKLKEKLIENKVYIPTLWPDVFDIAPT